AADDKKGEDILVLHVRPVSEVADFLLLASVTSPAHLRAVEEAVRLALKDIGILPSRRDGRASELWRVMDYGGLIVHLMHPEARAFYQLDKLFHGARKVSF
ncbi:MAG TPA: ribosome silencing factor, partial [Elusimicrobiota bacterium]|nr:ribosome silencing factor [Elusimicrobiota bacterium]